MDVSLCIATYRRPKEVARLLASIGRVKVPPGLEVEVVLADNDAATDPDRPLAADVTLPDIAIRRVREPRRHLAYARLTALAASRGRWVAFLDEDAMVEESWLVALWARVEEGDADGYFGPVLPDTGAQTASLANALLRRPLFDEVRFDPLLREGAVVPALVEALERSGARFEWCRDAVVLGSERPGHRTGPRSTLRRWIRAFERSERGAA